MTLMRDTNETIHRIWDDLSDFDLSQSEAAVSQLMTRLAQISAVWNVTWAGAIRMNSGVNGGVSGGGTVGANSVASERAEEDPLQGWRVAAMRSLIPIPPRQGDDHFKDILRVWEKREIDPSFLLPLREVGKFRTYSFRRELPATWFDSPFYHQHYGAVGIYDAAFVAFPLNADCESHFGFYAREPLPDQTIAQLTYALRGIKWFHRHLLLSHGLLMASTPLTPAEVKVVQLLLTEATERGIAERLGLADSTTHQYVVSIFRKFGVNSRAGLMSLWLNRG